MVDVLLPERIIGSEAICGGIEYRIACVAGSPSLPLKELILPLEIQFVTDCGQLRRVCGIVTEARAGDSDGGLTAYHLMVRDALAIMEKRTNSRIFRNLNELDIVQAQPGSTCCAYCSRNRCFNIFPVAPVGKDSTNTTSFGVHQLAILPS